MPEATGAGPGIGFQKCRVCAHQWYFRRPFCPSCGSPDLVERRSVGRGIVRAWTLIQRTTGQDDRPVRLALVDLDEGIRVMGRSGQVSVGSVVKAVQEAPGVFSGPYFEEVTDEPAFG